MARQTGISTQTHERLFIDSGAMYIDYGEPTERFLGATRGGNVFTVTQDVREMPVDGAHGPLRSMRRVIETKATITANLLEMTVANLRIALAGAEASDFPITGTATYDSIRRDRNIQDGDYFTNMALLGEISGSNTPVVLIIYNALADGNLELNWTDRDESVQALTLSAHFSPTDLDTEPWEIRYPKDVEAS